jgi:hypothetical protein
MNKVKYLFIFFLLFYNCKKLEKKSTAKSSTLKVKTNDLKNLIVNEGDSIILNFDLTMEWLIREEKILLTKENNKVFIQGYIKEKTQGLDNYFKKKKLYKIEYIVKDDSLNLKELIKENRSRLNKKGNDQPFFKIYNQKDTLIFYSSNLADKSKFIKKYFTIMANTYTSTKFYEKLE